MRCRISGCPDDAMPDKLRCAAHVSSGSGQISAVSDIPPSSAALAKAAADALRLEDLDELDLVAHLGRVSKELARRNRARMPISSDAVKVVRDVVETAIGRRDPRSD